MSDSPEIPIDPIQSLKDWLATLPPPRLSPMARQTCLDIIRYNEREARMAKWRWRQAQPHEADDASESPED